MSKVMVRPGLGLFLALMLSSLNAHAEIKIDFKTFLEYQWGQISGCAASLLAPRDLNRLKLLPETLREIESLIEAEFDDQILDQHLHAFHGSRHDLDADGNPHKPYNMRPWEPVALSSINSSQIVGMKVEDFVAYLLVSMEVEIPIHSYQSQSGKAFEYLLPSLSRFMGRTPEEQALADASGRARRCASVWCSEENRHGTLFARLVEQLTGQAPPLDNGAIPTITASTEAGALRHLSHRQGTEWGASGVYSVLIAHSTGPLRAAVLNVLRDEIKHLVVVSAADVYLRGHVPHDRNLRILEKTWIELKEGPRQRSSGATVYKNPYNLTEAAAGHVLIEMQMRRYLAQLPLVTLREIYDSPSQLRALPAVDRDAAAAREHERRLQIQNDRRRGLALWPLLQRRDALAQEAFEARYDALIENLVAAESQGVEAELSRFSWLERRRLRTAIEGRRHRNRILSLSPLPARQNTPSL